MMIHRDRKLMYFGSDRGNTERVGGYFAGKVAPNAWQNIRRHSDRGVIGRDPYYQDWLWPIGMRGRVIDGTDEGASSFKHGRAY
jgi:hypothetical protein